MNRRKWWDGLTELERHQHRLKSARGQLDSCDRRCRRLGWGKDKLEADPMYQRIERLRLQLEQLEIEAGLRRRHS